MDDRRTRTSVHSNLGAFMLVIMSHGDKGSGAGCDGKHVKITDNLDLLSPKNFPAMKKKPKTIIVRACAGCKYVSAPCRKGQQRRF